MGNGSTGREHRSILLVDVKIPLDGTVLIGNNIKIVMFMIKYIIIIILYGS